MDDNSQLAPHLWLAGPQPMNAGITPGQQHRMHEDDPVTRRQLRAENAALKDEVAALKAQQEENLKAFQIVADRLAASEDTNTALVNRITALEATNTNPKRRTS